MSFRTCASIAGTVTGNIAGEIFRQSTRPAQLVGLRTVGGIASAELPGQRLARRTWLAHGFPASFPVIGLIDEKIKATIQLVTAAEKQDLDAVPRIYQTMQRIDGEYAHAAGDNPRLCST